MDGRCKHIPPCETLFEEEYFYKYLRGHLIPELLFNFISLQINLHKVFLFIKLLSLKCSYVFSPLCFNLVGCLGLFALSFLSEDKLVFRNSTLVLSHHWFSTIEVILSSIICPETLRGTKDEYLPMPNQNKLYTCKYYWGYKRPSIKRNSMQHNKIRRLNNPDILCRRYNTHRAS